VIAKNRAKRKADAVDGDDWAAEIRGLLAEARIVDHPSTGGDGMSFA